jgi:L-aminoadipate-semialdehyde dehydrogenase
MPLNPNGKVDKPKLPFPDTAQAAPREAASSTNTTLTSTQKALSEIWAKLLPNAPSPIPIEDNFFDLGGHSILATRLIFEVRRAFVVDAPLSLIFDKPTIQGLSVAIDALRNDDLAFNASVEPAPPETNEPKLNYAADYEALVNSLSPAYDAVKDIPVGQKVTVFLTGGTGFLGSFILAHLLSLEQTEQVICLVRGKDDADALERLRSSAQDRDIWKDEWVADGNGQTKKVTVVTGDLSEPRFGLRESLWDELCQSVDAVVHNGALVNLSFSSKLLYSFLTA